MSMNYREVGEPHSGGRYAEGINIVNATVQDLEKKGLLPDRFPSIEIETLAHEAWRLDQLKAEVEKQVLRYQEFGFPKRLKMTNEKFKDQIMDLVTLPQEKYKGRFDIPVIVPGSRMWLSQQYRSLGFDQSDRELSYFETSDYGGYKTPRNPSLVWMQDGRKYFGRYPSHLFMNTDPNFSEEDERVANIYDGVGLMVARPDLLKDHSVFLPGTTADYGPGLGYMILLKLNKEGRPALTMSNKNKYDLMGSGIATCGR